MKCPNCGKTLSIPGRSVANMEFYGKAIVVLTLCCDSLVNCWPKFSYEVSAYVGARKEDDWGRAPKIKEKSE